MQRKIMMLAVLVTLSFGLGPLAGCASSGQDQNYKVLGEDRPMFETKPDPNKPGASLTAPHPGMAPGIAPGIAPATATLITTAPQKPTEVQAKMDPLNDETSHPKAANKQLQQATFDDGPQPVTQPAKEASPSKTATPALGGLAPAKPDAGDIQSTEPETAKKTQEALQVAGVAHSIDGLDRSNWERTVVGSDLGNSYREAYFHDLPACGHPVAESFLQPLKFVADIVMFPVKWICTPPWKKVPQTTADNQNTNVNPTR